VWHIPADQRAQRIQELLTTFGLWERRKDVVANWSRGMRQKLGVARTLMHHPELVFLDEPTAGLDPLASAALREDLSELAQKQGVTVFLTTHNLAEAEKLCQLVAVIREGKLLMIGSPDELRLRRGGHRLEVVGRGFNESVLSMLRQRPEVAGLEGQDHHIVIDLKGDPDTSELVRSLVQAGVQVDEVRKGAASLEEVFIESMEDKESQAKL
jgi:ABC-2 type transport system ATP-binding protein